MAAPLAGFVPLSVLAGVLVVLSWNMLDVGEGAKLLRWPDTALVLAPTFLGALVTDLDRGVVAGCVAAAMIAGLLGSGVARSRAASARLVAVAPGLPGC